MKMLDIRFILNPNGLIGYVFSHIYYIIRLSEVYHTRGKSHCNMKVFFWKWVHNVPIIR